MANAGAAKMLPLVLQDQDREVVSTAVTFGTSLFFGGNAAVQSALLAHLEAEDSSQAFVHTLAGRVRQAGQSLRYLTSELAVLTAATQRRCTDVRQQILRNKTDVMEIRCARGLPAGLGRSDVDGPGGFCTSVSRVCSQSAHSFPMSFSGSLWALQRSAVYWHSQKGGGGVPEKPHIMGGGGFKLLRGGRGQGFVFGFGGRSLGLQGPWGDARGAPDDTAYRPAMPYNAHPGPRWASPWAGPISYGRGGGFPPHPA